MFLFFNPTVKVKDGIVTISNIPARLIQTTLHRLYKTTRLNNYLFHSKNYNSIVFYEFFVLEFYFLLDSLVNDHRQRVSVKKIRQIQKVLSEETWLANTTVKHPDIVDLSKLDLFKYDPLEHQLEFFKHFNRTVPAYKLKGLLLAAAPGTGKTFASLALAECLNSDIIVVVCPKNALDTVWLKSTVGNASLYKHPTDAWSTSESKDYNGQKIAVVHYESLGKLENILNSLRNKKVTIIVDESHNFNELKSQRTNTLIDLCNRSDVKYVIDCSGSPIKALSVEAIPLLAVFDPLFTDEVRALFARLHSGEVSKLTEILQRRLNVISYKVDKTVLKREQPIITDIAVTVPSGSKFTLKEIAKDMLQYSEQRLMELKQLTPQAVVFFNSIISDIKVELLGSKSINTDYKNQLSLDFETYLKYVSIISKSKGSFLYGLKEELTFCRAFEKDVIIPNISDKVNRDKFKDIISIIKYPSLKVRGECLGRVLGKARIEAVKAMVPYIDYEDLIDSTEKKTLIFTSFVDVVSSVNVFLKKNYNPVMVYADYTKDLDNIVRKFDSDETVNPLIATYASLSTAVPLIMADTVIILNPPFRDYIMQQTIARVDRLGATSTVRVFNIGLDTGTEPNICSRNIDIIEWSKRQIGAIMGLPDDMPIDDVTIGVESVDDLSDYRVLSDNPVLNW